MPRGYPLKKMTVEEIVEHVNKTIPYVIGRGTESLTRRGREMKRLMGVHGHDVDKFGQHHSGRARGPKGTTRQTPRYDG